MLKNMMDLALCHLWTELRKKQVPPEDLRKWFKETKPTGCFFPYLVEPAGKIEKLFTLSPDPQKHDIAILKGKEIGTLEGHSATPLPFNKPSGPNSPQIGPVIKRSYSNTKGAGPTLTILNRTLNTFKEMGNSDKEWAGYFDEVYKLLNRSILSFAGEEYSCKHHALHEAVTRIPEKTPVFLAVETLTGKLPGDIPEYLKYLGTRIDASSKYTLSKAKPMPLDACPCCGEENVKGYPAGLSKAGVNIFNFKREGAFPGIKISNAHLSYAICEDCADLLYIFKFHVLDKYITYLAGQESLVLPELNRAPASLRKFQYRFKNYLEGIRKKSSKTDLFEKRRLLHLLKNEETICTMDILWSKDSLKGQSMGNLSGQVIDVLPSRLSSVDQTNQLFKDRSSPFYPKYKRFDFDLNLSFADELLKRPGGKKAQKANKSQNLIAYKRILLESIYKDKNISEERFLEEAMATAIWYFLALFDKKAKPSHNCLYEGVSEKDGQFDTWITFAGWTKNLAMTLDYLKFMGVMKKMNNTRTYVPEMEKLSVYFDEDSGINSNEKAFAFILGILYGRVMQIQGVKGVNVTANALTWLKRLTLTGKDLPDLYVKIRAKLLAYDAEKSKILREVIKEAGILGSKLGDNIDLSQTSCCYFLLLGQSQMVDILPLKTQILIKENEND